MLVEEGDIMNYIGIAYASILAKDSQVQASSQEQQDVMALITKKLTERERSILDRIPDMEEIEETIKYFKSGKSPRLDGLTVEVVRCCWVWIREECLEVIRAFWQDDILTTGAARGVI